MDFQPQRISYFSNATIIDLLINWQLKKFFPYLFKLKNLSFGLVYITTKQSSQRLIAFAGMKPIEKEFSEGHGS